MHSFVGKVVLITGASEGIGRALALELAGRGAQLALNARSGARLAELVSACSARGATALAVPGDVSRPHDCRAVIALTVARYGALDALVNNAGFTMWARFDQLTEFAVFERLLAVNYLGAVYMTGAALPHLKARAGLRVAVASVAGLTGVPERSGYAASKHARVGFFESLRIELAGSGVAVCIVAPDSVHSEIHRRAIGPDNRPLGISPMREARIMSAQRCARLIANAMSRRQRLLITSARGRLGRWVRLLAPGVGRCHGGARDPAPAVRLLEGDCGQIERDQKVLEQIFEHAHLVVQAVVTLEQMQRSFVRFGKTHAVFVRHDVIAPAVHYGRRTVEQPRTQLRQTLHIKRGSHEEHSARMQQGGGRHRHVTAQTGPDQYQIPAQLLAEVHQARHPRTRLLDAAIIDRVRLIPFRAGNFRERGDLAAPRSRVLAMREHYMAGSHRCLHGGPSAAVRSGRMRE
jgi:NAD(P)-dependent dehydrogenase (short-subunit alcohol dehydrogenase family)